jgi:arginine/lysine/ornithine decarboxylase
MKKDAINEERLPFTVDLDAGQLSITISGVVTAGIVKSKGLSAADIRQFLDSSQECRDFMKTWNCANLFKIREVLMAFIRSVFEPYDVEQLRIKWANGNDSLDIG